MKIKCIFPKNYNLTLNKEYDVLNQNETYYFIINDNFSEKRYSKELFEIIPEEEELMSYEELLNNIDYSDAESGTITINGIILDIGVLEYGTSLISCGIYQIEGINELVTHLDNDLDDEFLTNYSETYPLLLKELFLNIIKIYAKRNPMTLISTNMNNSDFQMQDEVLNELASTAQTTLNTNSSNDIKLWVLCKSDIE